MKSKEELKEVWMSWIVARAQAEAHLERVIEFEKGAKKRYYAEDHLSRVKTLEGEARRRYEEAKP